MNKTWLSNLPNKT